MIDIAGTELTNIERERLCHPLVGGLILFARNYQSPRQLKTLTEEIRALRDNLLIAVDHEGGRVQRFRESFTPLPPMRSLGARWEASPSEALEAARALGTTLAIELHACGVDFSFTPVLDLDYGRSTVIGDRAFHRRPEVVIALAGALIEGLRHGGVGNCGKHFPGHGWVEADSHLALPVDDRPLEALREDLRPYRELVLDAVMPAHVIYRQVDAEHTACFSRIWHDCLRNDIGFDGVVFSDDLSMLGASVAGDALARVKAAYAAGCDMLLLCNTPDEVDKVLSAWQIEADPLRSARIAALRSGGRRKP
jgi:beta-N-acetylhexosaminidase